MLKAHTACVSLAIVFFAATMPASAGPVAPMSYDTPNGESGLYTYFDDSYSGSGNKNVNGAALTGGLGDLTDGVLATGHWYQTPAAYVGWSSVAPEISFHFASIIAFSGATLYFDDQDGYGSVTRPTSIEFNTGSGFQSFAPTITVVGALAKYDFDLSGAQTSNIVARLNHPVGSSFIMLTEASFVSQAVPEPATWAMMVGVTGIAGLFRVRRRKDSLS